MKRYWFCVVEIEFHGECDLPDGADQRMRRAVQVAAESFAGVGEVGELYSGFGLNEKGAKAIQLESIMPINNQGDWNG